MMSDRRKIEEKLGFCRILSQLLVTETGASNEPDDRALNARALDIKESIDSFRYPLGGDVSDFQLRLDKIYERLLELGEDFKSLTGTDPVSAAVVEDKLVKLSRNRGAYVFLNSIDKYISKEDFLSGSAEITKDGNLTRVCVPLFDGERTVGRSDDEACATVSIRMNIAVNSVDEICGIDFNASADGRDMGDCGRKYWTDDDVAKAERFLYLFRGGAMIENEPFDFLNELIRMFTSSKPSKGFEIPYLEDAEELFGLYIAALGILDDSDDGESSGPDGEALDAGSSDKLKEIAEEARDIVVG